MTRFLHQNLKSPSGECAPLHHVGYQLSKLSWFSAKRLAWQGERIAWKFFLRNELAAGRLRQRGPALCC